MGTECKECNRPFKNVRALVTHVSRLHGSEEYIKNHGPMDDIAGEVFGRLTAVRIVGYTPMRKDGRRDIEWLFRCACGTETVKKVNAVRTVQRTTKSCGCLQDEVRNKNRVAWNDKSRLPTGEAAFNALLRTYQRGAEKRGYAWELGREEFKMLTSQPCFYCGAKPAHDYCDPAFNGTYVYNGVDRVDSAVGYTRYNTVPCCGRCNRAKGTMTMKGFKEFIQQVYRYWVQ